jgi:prepilin-type N-terminal cleavage/methylation domain-containing protein
MLYSALGDEVLGQRGFTLVELLVVMLIIVTLGAVVVVYFPQEALVVNQAAQGFEQQVLRARVEAVRTNRPAGVWLTEGDVNPGVAGVQPGYVVFLDGNGDRSFAGQDGGVGGNYKPDADGICKDPSDSDCDRALFVGVFSPDGPTRKTSEGVFSGVLPVNWSSSGGSAASATGVVFMYDPQGHFVQDPNIGARNGTVAFGRPDGSRKLSPPAQCVIVDTVGRVRRGEECL